MKFKKIMNIVKFIFFLIYILLIFFVKNNIALIIAATLNMLLILVLKINFTNLISSMAKIIIFIIATVIINIFIMDIKYSLLIGAKLILVCLMTYTFSSIISALEFATVIEELSYPLKIVGINPKDIGVLVSIALAFIPILSQELRNIKNILIVKGFKFNFINVLKNMNLIFKPFFISILERVNQLEYSLKSKGFE